MKKLFNTIVFTGFLCTSLFCQGQFSETLLDEDFDGNKFDTIALHLRSPGPLTIVKDMSGPGSHLETKLPPTLPYTVVPYPYLQNDLVYQNDEALQFDSLEATFLLDPALATQETPCMLDYNLNGHFRLSISWGTGLYYKDLSRDTVFRKDLFFVNSLEVWPGDAKSVQYNPSKKTIQMKWGKVSEITLLSYQSKIEYQDPSSSTNFIDDFQIVKFNFCNTTTNPTDCMQKVPHLGDAPLRLAIDNLVIKGLREMVTGLDDPSEMAVKKERHIVQSVDLMGKEIPDLSHYSGLAILLFSDGSKEKRVF
jgi:hypothetical protein